MGAIPASAGQAEGLASDGRPALAPTLTLPRMGGGRTRSVRSGANRGRRAGGTLAELIQHQVDDDRHDRAREETEVADLRVVRGNRAKPQRQAEKCCALVPER